MNDLALFDATRTTSVQCKACGATRNPGQTKAHACRVDRDRQAGTEHRRRPHGCLNAHDPATAPFPEGY